MSGNIVFSLPDRLIEKLAGRSIDGDKSLSTTAKRLLIELLEGSTVSVPTGGNTITSDSTIDRFDKLEDAIQGIYARMENERESTVDRLNALEDAIKAITDRFDRTDRSIADCRSTIAGVSYLLPPATTAGEVDRVTALEHRTEEMMKTLLELQEAASIAGRGETSQEMKTPPGEGSDDFPSIDSAVGDFSESSPKKSRERSTRESPKSQERPTFTTDLSIEEIQAKLTTGEGLTHAEFIEWNGLNASPRTVADWPTKMRAGEVAPRAYPNLQNEWEYRRERWFPLDSDGQTARQ